MAGSWSGLRNQDSNAGRAKRFFLCKMLIPALGLTTLRVQWIVGSLSFGGGAWHMGMKLSGAKVKSA